MLKDCIPKEFYEIKQIKELFDIEQKELNEIYLKYNDLILELFISSASKLIDRYEKEYNLSSSEKESLRVKRAKILAKKNTRLIPNAKNLSLVIKTLLNAKEVVIKEKLNLIEIYVKTANFIENMEVAKEFIRDTRPAHIAYNFINEIARNSEVNLYIGVINIRKKKEIIEIIEVSL